MQVERYSCRILSEKDHSEVRGSELTEQELKSFIRHEAPNLEYPLLLKWWSEDTANADPTVIARLTKEMPAILNEAKAKDEHAS